MNGLVNMQMRRSCFEAKVCDAALSLIFKGVTNNISNVPFRFLERHDSEQACTVKTCTYKWDVRNDTCIVVLFWCRALTTLTKNSGVWLISVSHSLQRTNMFLNIPYLFQDTHTCYRYELYYNLSLSSCLYPPCFWILFSFLFFMLQSAVKRRYSSERWINAHLTSKYMKDKTVNYSLKWIKECDTRQIVEQWCLQWHTETH